MPKVAELGSGRTGARRRASWMPGHMLSSSVAFWSDEKQD